MIKKLALAGILATTLATSAQAAKGLTSAQLDTLVFVYQEEKLARDVYITLGNLYPNQGTFASIQGSEQEHIDKAEGLCNTYGADISNIDEAAVGEFVLEEMQHLYDDLTAAGSNSELDALNVGVAIEELDIGDLEAAKEGMPKDVVNTYTNLISGSWNHLAAFNSAIEAYNAR